MLKQIGRGGVIAVMDLAEYVKIFSNVPCHFSWEGEKRLIKSAHQMDNTSVYVVKLDGLSYDIYAQNGLENVYLLQREPIPENLRIQNRVKVSRKKRKQRIGAIMLKRIILSGNGWRATRQTIDTNYWRRTYPNRPNRAWWGVGSCIREIASQTA